MLIALHPLPNHSKCAQNPLLEIMFMCVFQLDSRTGSNILEMVNSGKAPNEDFRQSAYHLPLTYSKGAASRNSR